MKFSSGSSRAPLRRKFSWGKGFALTVPAIGGYCIGSYASGELGYAPLRTEKWVHNRLDSDPSIEILKNGSDFRQLPSSIGTHDLYGRDGAVSQATVRFQDKKDSYHTVTYVHCGPLTVGFPFMVHGGVLGALLRQSAEQVYAINGSILRSPKGDLSIKYRRPTLVDQILKIETRKSSTGLELCIYDTKGTRLVEASYS